MSSPKVDEAREEEYLLLKTQLMNILLPRGGRVVDEWEFAYEDVTRWGLSRLIHEGTFLKFKVESRPGSDSQCHSNTLCVISDDPKIQFWSGYALSDSKVGDEWVIHSWGVDHRTDTIIETTQRRRQYFGVHLSRDDRERYFTT